MFWLACKSSSLLSIILWSSHKTQITLLESQLDSHWKCWTDLLSSHLVFGIFFINDILYFARMKIRKKISELCSRVSQSQRIFWNIFSSIFWIFGSCLTWIVAYRVENGEKMIFGIVRTLNCYADFCPSNCSWNTHSSESMTDRKRMKKLRNEGLRGCPGRTMSSPTYCWEGSSKNRFPMINDSNPKTSYHLPKFHSRTLQSSKRTEIFRETDNKSLAPNDKQATFFHRLFRASNFQTNLFFISVYIWEMPTKFYPRFRCTFIENSRFSLLFDRWGTLTRSFWNFLVDFWRKLNFVFGGTKIYILRWFAKNEDDWWDKLMSRNHVVVRI